jgi:hypothetical protein
MYTLISRSGQDGDSVSYNLHTRDTASWASQNQEQRHLYVRFGAPHHDRHYRLLPLFQFLRIKAVFKDSSFVFLLDGIIESCNSAKVLAPEYIGHIYSQVTGRCRTKAALQHISPSGTARSSAKYRDLKFPLRPLSLSADTDELDCCYALRRLSSRKGMNHIRMRT